MKRLKTEIEVEASAERVWEILTDFDSFPDWNPFIPRAIGVVQEEEELEVHIRPPGSKGMTFKPKVIFMRPPQELRWLGRLWVPGIFDGEHFFIIEPTSTNRLRFVHGENFRGILVPFLSLMGVFKDIERGFVAMNLAIKARAEGPLG